MKDYTEIIEEEGVEVITDLKEAIIGISYSELKPIYSVSKCLEIIKKETKLSDHDTLDLFYNIIKCSSSIFCWDFKTEDAE